MLFQELMISLLQLHIYTQHDNELVMREIGENNATDSFYQQEKKIDTLFSVRCNELSHPYPLASALILLCVLKLFTGLILNGKRLRHIEKAFTVSKFPSRLLRVVKCENENVM